MDNRHRGTGIRGRRGRALSLGGAALALASGLALAASSGAGAAPLPNPAWSQAKNITLPAGGVTTVGSQLLGVGCTPGKAYCVAGGYFAKSSTSGTLPMIVTFSNGSWGKARQLLLPANATAVPVAEVTSVSCPTSTSCVAFGYYRYKGSGTKRNAFVAQKTASGWGRGHTLPLPKNVNSPTNAWSGKITCPSPGNCTAVGVYIDKDLDHETFAINETHGAWVQGHWIWTPPDAPKTGKNVQPYGVSCSSNTSCVTVGKYRTAKGDTEPYVVQGQTNAAWNATAQRIKLPADAVTGKAAVGDFHGVQCPAAGNCVAVGNYLKTGGSTGVYYETEAGGTWAAGGTEFAATPPGAATPPKPQDNGLFCFGTTTCVTVGFYTNLSNRMSPLSDMYADGPAWQTAANVAPPGAYRSASLKDVSCWGNPWTCVAVGSYVNGSGHTLPMVAQSS